MAGQIRARWSLLVALIVASALLVGLGVTLAMNRTGEATSAQGAPEAQPSATTSEDHPEYRITIRGNTYAMVNGTWDLRKVTVRGKDRWTARPAHPDGPPFALIALTPMREEASRAAWGQWLEVEWPGEKWLVTLHKLRDPNVRVPTGWVGPNTTQHPDAEPYQYAYGPYDGGTVVVHKR